MWSRVRYIYISVYSLDNVTWIDIYIITIINMSFYYDHYDHRYRNHYPYN